jgi:hypothetical protein
MGDDRLGGRGVPIAAPGAGGGGGAIRRKLPRSLSRSEIEPNRSLTVAARMTPNGAARLDSERLLDRGFDSGRRSEALEALQLLAGAVVDQRYGQLVQRELLE